MWAVTWFLLFSTTGIFQAKAQPLWPYGHVWPPWATGVFRVAADGREANMTQMQLSRVISQARRLRQVSWCVTVVVVSDDPVFLAAFAQWSLKGRLLAWSTRLLALTRLPLSELRHIYKNFSMTNSMIMIVENVSGSFSCSVYVLLPYIRLGAKALRVASWTPDEGLAPTSHLSVFPDKFSRFAERPTLVAVTEVNPINKMKAEDVSGTPGERWFTGPVPKLVQYLAQAQNFSYVYMRPPDGSWGFKHVDGSWTGMVGMVSREEADIGVGPFGVSATRAEVVDFTGPIMIDYWRIMGGRGRPEVNPWGFLLPLAPLVWTVILTALVVVPVIMFLLSSCISDKRHRQRDWVADCLTFIRVLLQQDITLPWDWWWERLVLGVWMMVTLVLTRSYSGNLMSLLAVRHIPQPYQSLRDVLDDPSVITIWETESASVQYLHSVESGIFRELADLEESGRILYRTQSQFGESIDTLVRRGDHVLMEVEMSLKAYMAQDFSLTGRCDFYAAREVFLPFMIAMAGPKGSPLVPSMSKRIKWITQTGLYYHWMETVMPNVSYCDNPPTKTAVSTSLALSNVWGMFAVLLGGHTISLLVLGLELLSVALLQVENVSTLTS
ncbi:glutamate receptor-like [Panulirus ornatus]|uniref:glutamate receptor-like n=1 Tax=Panulirus ornatus TaxID=150431 RepID=UPI003A87EBB2